MATFMAILDWVKGPSGVLLFAVLFGLSETLAQIPMVKANSIFQAIQNILGFMKNKILPAPPQA